MVTLLHVVFVLTLGAITFSLLLAVIRIIYIYRYHVAIQLSSPTEYLACAFVGMGVFLVCFSGLEGDLAMAWYPAATTIVRIMFFAATALCYLAAEIHTVHGILLHDKAAVAFVVDYLTTGVGGTVVCFVASYNQTHPLLF